MLKFFKIIFISSILASCGAIVSKGPIYDLPYSTNENAPPIWKLGWQHGCYSGFSAYGNDFFKSQYKFTQDLRYIKDEMYFKGWTDSFNYCRAYVNRTLSGDSKISYEENPTLFSPNKLDTTFGNKRNDPTIYKTGLFGGRSNKGFFGDMFDFTLPGTGANGWGESADECDWLNRCGDDIPSDPIDGIMGR